VITPQAAGAPPRCKNVHHCTLIPHAAPDHNSAIPVAAVELIVYADYADADRLTKKRRPGENGLLPLVAWAGVSAARGVNGTYQHCGA
jgi:hypothetical protein